MKDEIKEIKISKSNHSIVIIKNGVTVKEQFAIDDEILDYITNLQKLLDFEIERNDIKQEIMDKAIEYVTYLGLKCKYRLNTGHLRKLRKILIGDEK